MNGAERLLGRGDMLFLRSGHGEPIRIHGAFFSGEETERLVEQIRNSGYQAEEVQVFSARGGSAEDAGDRDELFDEAVAIVLESRQASTSYLQRRMKVGYSRAARLMDELELAGIVGPPKGPSRGASSPRAETTRPTRRLREGSAFPVGRGPGRPVAALARRGRHRRRDHGAGPRPVRQGPHLRGPLREAVLLGRPRQARHPAGADLHPQARRFRVQLEGGDLVVADGEAIWAYSKTNEQVIVSPYDGGVLRTPWEVLVEYSDGYRTVAVERTDLDGREVYMLTLQPTEDVPPALRLKRMRLWVEERGWRLLRIEQVEPNDDVSTFILSGHRRDGRLDDDLFASPLPRAPRSSTAGTRSNPEMPPLRRSLLAAGAATLLLPTWAAAEPLWVFFADKPGAAGRPSPGRRPARSAPVPASTSISTAATPPPSRPSA